MLFGCKCLSRPLDYLISRSWCFWGGCGVGELLGLIESWWGINPCWKMWFTRYRPCSFVDWPHFLSTLRFLFYQDMRRWKVNLAGFGITQETQLWTRLVGNFQRGLTEQRRLTLTWVAPCNGLGPHTQLKGQCGLSASVHALCFITQYDGSKQSWGPATMPFPINGLCPLKRWAKTELSLLFWGTLPQ